MATSLNNLAGLYTLKGDYKYAEPLYQRALAIYGHALGAGHPLVATALSNLAELHSQKGNYAGAEALHQLALKIKEKALGPEHPDVAFSLHNLASVYQSKGDFARAEPLYERALDILQKALGPEHPDVARALSNFATLDLARNRTQAAIQKTTQAAAIEDRNATRELSVGSDEQRRAYMATLRGGTNTVISLHVHVVPKDQNAERLALTTILNRKGRVLDAMVDSSGAWRSRLAPADRVLFDQWRSLTAQYTATVARGPGALEIDQYRSGLKALDDQRQAIEGKLSFRTNELGIALRPVTLGQVGAVIPEGAALVEVFRYEPFDAKREKLEEKWGSPRYVAYVLRHGGEIAWTDLGEAAPIEAAVSELLPTLRRAAADPQKAARKLDALVMEPLRRLLGDTRWVLLSPDDVLNLVPFAALIDESGHYLVERYSFTYLASGRDLVRMRHSTPAKGGAVVIGAPDFESAPGASLSRAIDPTTNGNVNERSAELGTRSFGPLRFAAEEARALQKRIGTADLLLGPKATESALKALHGPRLLHIATHGFFLPDQVPIEAPTLDPGGMHAGGGLAPGLRYAENALLRSGLALAGANQRQSGNDDGILTALEASQLDLYGTKLVVMSACETGVGKAESGDGVYGLRRALTIAGAETQVMSLWKVDDAATDELMDAYYAGLLANGGRSEALRPVQLAMLHSPERAHPYYWAGFIVSGNPAALDGKQVTPDFAKVTPDFAKVQPGVRGCGCELVSNAPSDAGAWAALIVALGVARGRRRNSQPSGSCARWLGAAAIGAAVLVGAPDGGWGQSAPPDAAALVEAERLNREVFIFSSEGKLDAAFASAVRALAFNEKALGPDTRRTPPLAGRPRSERIGAGLVERTALEVITKSPELFRVQRSDHSAQRHRLNLRQRPRKPGWIHPTIFQDGVRESLQYRHSGSFDEVQVDKLRRGAPSAMPFVPRGRCAPEAQAALRDRTCSRYLSSIIDHIGLARPKRRSMRGQASSMAGQSRNSHTSRLLASRRIRRMISSLFVRSPVARSWCA